MKINFSLTSDSLIFYKTETPYTLSMDSTSENIIFLIKGALKSKLYVFLGCDFSIKEIERQRLWLSKDGFALAPRAYSLLEDENLQIKIKFFLTELNALVL